MGAASRVAAAIAILPTLSTLIVMPAAAAPRQTQAAGAAIGSVAARAEAAREAGRLDEAVALYRQALTQRPRWQEGWWALGTILYELDAYAAAARAFARLVALDAKNGTASLMLGLCEYQLDRDTAAMTHIAAAKALGVQKDGQLPQILAYHEGMLLLRAGRYERALEALQPLVAAEVADETLDVALGLAVLLIRPKDAPADSSPAHRLILRAGQAERQSLLKAFTVARERYTALVAEAPDLPNVHYAYGRFLLATDDLDAAVAEFLKEIEKNPSHVRARMQVAAARYRVDSTAGIPFAQDVVKLAPDYPFGHYLLGLLYLDSGDAARAIPELERAARLVPREPQFQFALGSAYARVGRKDDAARARAAFVRLQGKDDPTAKPRLDLDARD